MFILRGILLALAFILPATAQQVGCFPLAQSQSGPVAFTEWCQIADYSGQSPLTATYDTGFVTLDRGFSAQTLHIQYDDWYAPMTVVISIELLRAFGDLVMAPITIGPFIQDIPLGLLGANAGDRIRIIWTAAISHPCGLLDNCGLHFTLTFD